MGHPPFSYHLPIPYHRRSIHANGDSSMTDDLSANPTGASPVTTTLQATSPSNVLST